MNDRAFIRGFLDELEKKGMGMGIGPTPTQAMSAPPVGGSLRLRKPRPPAAMGAASGSPAPMQNPVATPVG